MVEALDVPAQKYLSLVRTASGDDRSITGRVELPVECRGQTKRILFYVCPYMKQKAYFGVNFWQAFVLAPAVIGHGDPESVKKADEVHAREMEHYAEREESWALSEADAR